jgi:CxxC motif-containing protein (DUF1111 family)
MRKATYLAFIILFISCKKENVNINDASEEFPGGATTYKSIFSGSFEQPASNLNSAEFLQHSVGDATFSAKFVTSPALVNQGLGPIFNQVSCVSCHPKNGKSSQPLSGLDLKGLLFRVSIPRADESLGPLPLSGFGGQLQTKASVGKQAEGQVQISFEENTFTFSDGTPYSLRKPIYTITSANTSIPFNMMVSPRIAQQVIGLGLIEAISDANILLKADENDANSDGISGKANRVWNPVSNAFELGRFGWKANNATLLAQSATALHEDMGITSYVFRAETTVGQIQDNGPSLTTDVDSQLVIDLAFYTQSLAVPKRRDFNDASVNNGKLIFFKIGCDKCHTQKYVTGTNAISFLSNQTIYPYTDLLLHDMGSDLADGRPDFLATGNEWRTPPLWGIGLSELTNGHTDLLHDGRARNTLEAIMWHGGEAENQKVQVKKLSKKEREDLVKFVNSL